MVNLSKKAVEDFIKIYELEFGVRLDDSEARPMASKFLQFFALIYRGGKNGKIIEDENSPKN